MGTMQIYKKPFFKKLFNIDVKCKAENCNYIFKEGDLTKSYDQIFGDIYPICEFCYKKMLKEEYETKKENLRIQEKKKHEVNEDDYKILTEKVQKLIDKIDKHIGNWKKELK